MYSASPSRVLKQLGCLTASCEVSSESIQLAVSLREAFPLNVSKSQANNVFHSPGLTVLVWDV